MYEHTFLFNLFDYTLRYVIFPGAIIVLIVAIIIGLLDWNADDNRED